MGGNNNTYLIAYVITYDTRFAWCVQVTFAIILLIIVEDLADAEGDHRRDEV